MKKPILLLLAAVLAAVAIVSCKANSPTEPGAKLDTGQIALQVNLFTGQPIDSALVDICIVSSTVESMDTALPDSFGFIPPKLLHFPTSFFDSRPWKVHVYIRAKQACGSTGNVQCFTPFDEDINIDWGAHAGYDKFLLGNVVIPKTIGGVALPTVRETAEDHLRKLNAERGTR